MFDLLRWQLALTNFLGNHVINTFDWIFLCTVKLWLGKGDFAWFSTRWGEQPNVVEHFIESSKVSYSCCVYKSWNKWLFLMQAMLMICVRQKNCCLCKLCGKRAVGLSHDFLDFYQFSHRISNKIVSLAVSQEWWDLLSMTNYHQLCWEDSIITQDAVEPHERSSLPQDILSHSYWSPSPWYETCWQLWVQKQGQEPFESDAGLPQKLQSIYQINCILYVVNRNRMFMPIFYQQNHEKNHVLNFGPHSEIDICSCNDCGFARYVCNDCKQSHIHLREFKRVQCVVKNLRDCIDHENDYLQSHSFYSEDGSPDDEYDSLQKPWFTFGTWC